MTTKKFVSLMLWSGLYLLAIPLLLSKGAEAHNAKAISPQGQFVVDVPFLYDPPLENHIIVQAEVNGKGPFSFILDTGAEAPIMIDQWAADELGLQATGEELTVTPGNTKVRLAKLNRFIIRGNKPAQSFTFNPTVAAVGDFDSLLKVYRPLKVAGVIGLPVFSLLKAQFDFARHVLFLYPASASIRYGVRAIRIPLHQTEWKAFAPVSPAGGPPIDMRLDTGTNVSDVPQMIARRLGPIVVDMSVRQTLAGQSSVQRGLVRNFMIGGITIHNVYVSPILPGDAVLSLDILSRFKVTLDLPHKLLILEPSSSTANPILGDTGLSVSGRDQSLFVDSVWAGSAAYKARLAVGDQILEVDGQSIADLDSDNAASFLEGVANTKARLSVRRNGSVLKTIEFTRSSITDPANYLAPGFRIDRLDQYPTTGTSSDMIVSILCSSPAWTAGVRAGDVLLSINGVSVTGRTISEVDDMLQKPAVNLTLTVQHQGQPQTQTLTLSTGLRHVPVAPSVQTKFSPLGGGCRPSTGLAVNGS